MTPEKNRTRRSKGESDHANQENDTEINQNQYSTPQKLIDEPSWPYYKTLNEKQIFDENTMEGLETTQSAENEEGAIFDSQWSFDNIKIKDVEPNGAANSKLRSDMKKMKFQLNLQKLIGAQAPNRENIFTNKESETNNEWRWNRNENQKADQSLGGDFLLQKIKRNFLQTKSLNYYSVFDSVI